MKRVTVEAGTVFGRWVVVETGTIRVRCRCECGTERVVTTHNLRAGSSRSCGCVWVTHGQSRNRTEAATYKIWHGMRDRCSNANTPLYPNYGGGGITVCDRWNNSYAAFYEDMGDRPSKDHSLDRIDNDGPYSPENCRWATRKEQARNKRTNRKLTRNGVTKLMCEWAEEMGCSVQVISNRPRWGWGEERALSTPVRPRRRVNKTGQALGSTAGDHKVVLTPMEEAVEDSA